jgi:hypothetical protein
MHVQIYDFQHFYRNLLVLLEKSGLVRKLSAPRMGPHTVTEIYTNGTVHIQRGVCSQRTCKYPSSHPIS